MEKNIQVYDLEIYPNLFLYVDKNIKTNEISIFEISKRKDDRAALLEHLKTVGTQIGFNNLSFDYPLLHTFIRLFPRQLQGKRLVEQLYKKGQSLIKADNRWTSIVKKPFIQQVDLFMINHYDNFAKSTNLKVLEFNMEMTNIQTLPYKFNKYLTDDEIQNIVDYCENDVDATFRFWKENVNKISFRERFSKLYNHDFTNYNDVKIGEQILLDAVSKGMNLSQHEVKKMRTYRKSMNMSDIIFDYIKFETVEFKALLNWWKDKVIFETKGQFTGLDMDIVAPLLPYCNNETVKGKLKNLNIILNDIQFDFGTGGLHSYCYPGVFKSGPENDIILVDVSSYYPNLAYHNGLHPLHIFKDIFLNTIFTLYSQRMDGKKVGDMEIVAAIKLALNGALYGKSNSAYSFMYDPQFMMSICVNGQLLLTMLTEQFMLAGIKIIQVNTDGIMVDCPKDNRYMLDKLSYDWMKMTNLKLDYDHFELVVQRDVNNYMGKFTNGKIKYKGVFDFNYASSGDWHKNFSMLIVPQALNAYFIDEIPVMNFLNQQIIENPDAFFKRTKYNKITKLVQREYDEEENFINQTLLQNVTRYYVSNEGNHFIKIMPPLKGEEQDREFAVESGFLCTEMNTKTSERIALMKQNINLDYYYTKIYDVINLIEDYMSVDDLSFKIID